MDWDAEPEAPEGFAPTEDESRLLDALRRRGASFSSALSALLGGRSALEPLLRLAQAGLVRADSFAPLRALPEVLQAGRAPGKRLARLRSGALSAGRWELARPERALCADERLERAFSACPILSRETVTGLPWAEAADLLRHWEYTGRARRGYFVQGLSGMQFVRAQDYARVRHALDHPGAAALWLPAQDPGQAYGRALAHLQQADRRPGAAGGGAAPPRAGVRGRGAGRAGARFRRAPHLSASRPALHPRLSGGRGVRARAGGVCPPHARLRALSIGAAAPGIDFWPVPCYTFLGRKAH